MKIRISCWLQGTKWLTFYTERKNTLYKLILMKIRISCWLPGTKWLTFYTEKKNTLYKLILMKIRISCWLPGTKWLTFYTERKNTLYKWILMKISASVSGINTASDEKYWDVTQVMETRSVWWAGHVPDRGEGEERRSAYRALLGGKTEAKMSLESLYVDVRIILKCNFKKQDRKTCTGLIWLSARAL